MSAFCLQSTTMFSNQTEKSDQVSAWKEGPLISVNPKKFVLERLYIKKVKLTSMYIYIFWHF